MEIPKEWDRTSSSGDHPPAPWWGHWRYFSNNRSNPSVPIRQTDTSLPSFFLKGAGKEGFIYLNRYKLSTHRLTPVEIIYQMNGYDH